MEKKYIIKYGDKEFEASEYQAKIFDAIEYGVGNIIINAAAGSSKTTSLVNAINYISNDKKVLFVAFNKDIAEKIREMVKRENTDVHTFHSLGRSLLIENNIITNETPINDYKYNIYIKENINNLTKEGETKSLKRQYNHYINNIIKLTEYCRYFHYMKKNKINSLVKMYGIELVRDEIDVVINVLKWGQTNFNEIDYTDMIWLPVQLNLTTKRKLYDFIFVDEAQDTSIIEQELVFKTFKRGARFCTCGDNFQCQPKGTQILMGNKKYKNIEDVEIGEKVVTYMDKSRSYFKGYNKTGDNNRGNASRILGIESHISHELIKITTENGLTSEYTPEHITYIKFNEENCKNKYILYLMCDENKERFRIGTTRLYNPIKVNTFGLKARMRSENCTYGWILKIYDNRHDCLIDETLFSVKYGIPQLIFEPERAGCTEMTKEDVTYIYNNLGYSVKERAIELLTFFKKNIKYPFTSQLTYEKNARNYIRSINVCNLFTDIMDVKVFNENETRYRTHGVATASNRYEIIGHFESIKNIEYKTGDFEVYSLDVDKEHNYVADGILTHNCINLWCGANKEAIDNFRKLPNTEDFYLPISYRCPKKIVELASNFSDNIIAAPNAIEGEIKYNVNINFAQSNDMVLCRTTAPLIKQHLSFLRNNKKSFIRGFETIKTDLLNLIDNSHSKTIDKNMLTKDGLFSRVYENMINVGEGLKKQFNLSEEEMVVHPTILTIYDNIQCLAVLSEGLNTVEELKEKINTIFNGDSNDAIQLSTIHKAKGLEADNVYILCPESLPSPIARLDWERETERNLQYVAYTRAKKTLNFVADDNSFMWVRFKAQFSPKAMKELFDKCRNTLKYNNEMDISEDVIDVTLQKRKQIRELGSNVTPIQTITNKKQKGGLKFAKLMQ